MLKHDRKTRSPKHGVPSTESQARSPKRGVSSTESPPFIKEGLGVVRVIKTVHNELFTINGVVRVIKYVHYELFTIHYKSYTNHP